MSGFSLSLSSRGTDFVIGGSGVLDIDGIRSLRQMVEDSCKKEGASVSIDLLMVSELAPDVVVHLVETADFCRGLGVPFAVSFGANLVAVLNAAGYDAELMPLAPASDGS